MADLASSHACLTVKLKFHERFIVVKFLYGSLNQRMLLISRYDYHSIDSASEPKSQAGPDYKASPSYAQPVTLPATQSESTVRLAVGNVYEQAQPTSLPQPVIQTVSHAQAISHELAPPTTLPEPQPINGAPPQVRSYRSEAVSHQPMSPPRALHETPTPRQASTSQPATLPEGQPISPLYAQLQTLPQGQPVAPPATPIVVHDNGDHFLSEVYYTNWVSISSSYYY